MPTADSTSQKRKKSKSKKVEEEENSDTELEASTSTFKAPAGFQEIKYDSNTREFDWDTFNTNPDLELWAIRLPLKAKHLNNMSFPLPAAGSNPSGPLAQISAGKKQTRYSISLSSAASGGEELIGASCMLPRASKGGRLQIAPRPITGALTLSEIVTSGQAEATTEEPETGRLPLPSSTRYSHPAHLLTHRFVPTAVSDEMESTQLRDRDVNAMDIVEEEDDIPKDVEPSSPKKHHKKRKKEGLGEGQVSKKARVE